MIPIIMDAISYSVEVACPTVACPPKIGPPLMRDSCRIRTGGNRENKKVFGGAGIQNSQGS